MENTGLIRRQKETLTHTVLIWVSLLLFVLLNYNLEQQFSTWGFPRPSENMDIYITIQNSSKIGVMKYQ